MKSKSNFQWFLKVSKLPESSIAIVVIVATMFSIACAGRGAVSIEKLSQPPCPTAAGVAWAGPEAEKDRARLSAWCKSVGSIVVRDANPPAVDVESTGLTVVTWNQHEDYGDLEGLLRSLTGRSPFILLLQEVARTSNSVPFHAPESVRVPGRINPPGQMKQDIETIAREFNLSLAYLPSMPNGFQTHEDRGCAILSTLALSDVMGIELPWVAQRRVAVMATATAMKGGVPWYLRVVSVHLDNRSGRTRQATAIADFIGRQQSSAGLPMVIGGDFNTLYSIKDRAVSEIDRIAPLVRECGDRATFPLRFWFDLRLDHFFTTLPQNIRAGCVVEKERFGSDHYPIVLHLFKSSSFHKQVL